MLKRKIANFLRIIRCLGIPIILAGLLCSSCAFEPGEGGIGGTGIIAIGPIQKFGSIFVNGRELFLNRETLISSNGVLLTESQLRLGDMVIAEAYAQKGQMMIAGLTLDTGIQGKIERIDRQRKTITLLGQTIQYDETTRGDSNQLLNSSQLRTGDNITISGMQRDNTTWLATRITRNSLNDTYRLRGNITSIDNKSKQIVIGNTQINSATTSAMAGLSVNMPVTIQGNYGANGKLTMTRAFEDKPRQFPLGSRIELSGFVQSTSTQGEFTTQGLIIKYDHSSDLQNKTGNAPQRGSFVMLRGHVISAGVVAADTMILNVAPQQGVLPSINNDDTDSKPGNGRDKPNTGADHSKPSPPGLIHRPMIVHPERPVR